MRPTPWLAAAALLALAPFLAAPAEAAYVRTDLVGDDTALYPAPLRDPDSVNPWDVAPSARI